MRRISIGIPPAPFILLLLLMGCRFSASEATPAVESTHPSQIISVTAESIQPVRTATPTDTITPTPSLTPTATVAAPEVVLPGWVPEGARARLGRGKINRIALSPDGKTVAVAGAAGLSLFQTETLREIWSVATSGSVDTVSFAADGKSIVTLSMRTESTRTEYRYLLDQACIWDASDGSLQRIVPIHLDQMSAFRTAVSPDGRMLAIVQTDDQLKTSVTTLDLKNGRRIWTREDKKLRLDETVVFSRQGDLLIAGSSSGDYFFLDPGTGEIVRRLDGVRYRSAWETTALTSLAVSPDGRWIAAAIGDIFSGENIVLLWDAFRNIEAHILGGMKGFGSALAFSPDGAVLSAGDDKGAVLQWEVESGALQHAHPAAGSRVNSLAFSPDGKTLLSGYRESISFWDVASGASRASLTEPYSYWMEAAFLPGGNELGLLGPGRIQRVDTAVWRYGESHPLPEGAYLSPDYRKYALFPPGGPLTIRGVETGEELNQIPHPDFPGSFVGFSFSPDGVSGAIISISDSADEFPIHAGIWDLAGGRKKLSVDCSTAGWMPNEIHFLFSPDGKYFALGILDWEFGMQATVYDAATGRQAGFFEERALFLFAFSPEEGVVAAPCGLQICLYDISGKNPRSRFDVEEAAGTYLRIERMIFSGDGSLLAAGTTSGEVVVWNAGSGELVSILHGHNGSIRNLSFSQDGRYLASTGADGSAVVWDLKSA